jgi:hypothetical protein
MRKPMEEVCPNPNDAMRRFPGLPKTNSYQNGGLNQSCPTFLAQNIQEQDQPNQPAERP